MMTAPAAMRLVRCPTCADKFPWQDTDAVSIYDEATGQYEVVNLTAMDAVKRKDIRRRGYRLCPNPSQDTPEHYLPASYADYDDPLVIGLIGLTSSGKTHLLTAMIREAPGGLMPLGVQTTSLDRYRHATFQSTFLRRFERGEELRATGAEVYDAAEVLLLRGNGKVRPVTFFDVAGEQLADLGVQNRASRFLLGVNAVIFVHAAEDPTTENDAARSGENPVFDLATERIVNLPGGRDIPAAIALTKADRLRYVPPADRWLRLPVARELSWRDSRAESRDVYAYLHRNGGRASLVPFELFNRCSLHFVSASGGDSVRPEVADEGVAVEQASREPGAFPRGVRPMRVLQPLISLLAMSGFLGGPDAEQIGRW